MSTVTVEPVNLYTITYRPDNEAMIETANCIRVTMSNKYLGYDQLAKDDEYTEDFRVFNKIANRIAVKDVTTHSIVRQANGGLLITRRT